MSKKRHECRVCGETFASVTDHLVHVTTAHDLRRTGGRDRTRTRIACRSCGTGDHIDGAPCGRCGTALRLG